MTLTIYNQPKYGVPLYYGSVDQNARYLWGFMVKWDKDYVNEALNLIDLSVERGRDGLFDNDGWKQFEPGTAEAILDNSDGRYDPYNTSSPLYGYILPGKYVWILVKDTNTGTKHNIMYGKIKNIQPYQRNNRRLAKITVVDGLDFLKSATTTVTWFNYVWSTLRIRDMVENSGWPLSEWPMGLVTSGPEIFRSWFFKRNAIDAINEMANSAKITYFHSANGEFARYLGSYTYASTTTINEGDILRDITVSQPWDNIINDVDVYDNAKALGTYSQLYEVQSPIPINAGETVTFDAVFRYESHFPVGAYTIGTPEIGTFNVNTLADGTGTDITASCVKYWPLTDYGEGITVAVTNNSASNGYIRQCSVWGGPVYIQNSAVWRAEDATSIATYGRKSIDLNFPWVVGAEYSITYRDWVLANFKDPKRYVTIKLENQPTLQFGKELYKDRIRLVVPTLGIDSYFRIGKIKHKWLKENGLSVETTYQLEPYLTALTLPDQPTS